MRFKENISLPYLYKGHYILLKNIIYTKNPPYMSFIGWQTSEQKNVTLLSSQEIKTLPEKRGERHLRNRPRTPTMQKLLTQMKILKRDLKPQMTNLVLHCYLRHRKIEVSYTLSEQITRLCYGQTSLRVDKEMNTKRFL